MIDIDPSSEFVKTSNSTWQNRVQYYGLGPGSQCEHNHHYFAIRCLYQTSQIHCKQVFGKNWKYLDSHNTVGLYRIIQPFPILEGLVHPITLSMYPLDFRPCRPYLSVAPHLRQCAQLKSTVNRYRDIEPAEQQPGPNGFCRAAMDVKWRI